VQKVWANDPTSYNSKVTGEGKVKVVKLTRSPKRHPSSFIPANMTLLCFCVIDTATSFHRPLMGKLRHYIAVQGMSSELVCVICVFCVCICLNCVKLLSLKYGVKCKGYDSQQLTNFKTGLWKVCFLYAHNSCCMFH